jgi:hypothetical protein
MGTRNRLLIKSRALTISAALCSVFYLWSADAGQIISITYADLPTSTNDLTAKGTLDWIKWGNGETLAPYTTPRKFDGAIIDPTLTPLGTVPAGQSVALVPFGPVPGLSLEFAWTNGTSPMATTPVGTSVSETISPNQFSYPTGLGLSFQATAGDFPRLLTVYVAAFNARMKLDASLTGGASGSLLASNALLIPVSAGNGSNVVSYGTFAISYSGTGETLTVNLTATDQVGIPSNAPQFGFPNAGVYAATVESGQSISPSPILLTRVASLPGGALRFGFANLPGLSFSVFTSTNPAAPFTDWAPVGQATEISAGQFQFTDPQPASGSQLFYRVRWP